MEVGGTSCSGFSKRKPACGVMHVCYVCVSCLLMGVADPKQIGLKIGIQSIRPLHDYND